MRQIAFYGTGVNRKTGKEIRFAVPESILNKGRETIQKNSDMATTKLKGDHGHQWLDPCFEGAKTSIQKNVDLTTIEAKGKYEQRWLDNCFEGPDFDRLESKVQRVFGNVIMRYLDSELFTKDGVQFTRFFFTPQRESRRLEDLDFGNFDIGDLPPRTG